MFVNSDNTINQDMIVIHTGFEGTSRVIPRPKSSESFNKNIEIANAFMEKIREHSNSNYIDSRVRDSLNEIYAELMCQNLYVQKDLISTVSESTDAELVRVDGFAIFGGVTMRGISDWEFNSMYTGITDFPEEELKEMAEHIDEFKLALDSDDLEESVKQMAFLLTLDPQLFAKEFQAFSDRFNIAGDNWEKTYHDEFATTGEPMLFLCNRQPQGFFEQETMKLEEKVENDIEEFMNKNLGLTP